MTNIDDLLSAAPEPPDDNRNLAASSGGTQPEHSSQKEPTDAVPTMRLPQSLCLAIRLSKEESGTRACFDQAAVGRLCRACIEAAAPLCIPIKDEYPDFAARHFSAANEWRQHQWKEVWDYGEVPDWVPAKAVARVMDQLKAQELPGEVGDSLRHVVGSALIPVAKAMGGTVGGLVPDFSAQLQEIPCLCARPRFERIFPTGAGGSEYVVGFRNRCTEELVMSKTWVSDFAFQRLLNEIAADIGSLAAQQDVTAACRTLSSYSECRFPVAWRQLIIGMIHSAVYEFVDLPEYRFYGLHRFFGTELAEIDWLWAQRKKSLTTTGGQ